jgi:hypothetical protein
LVAEKKGRSSVLKKKKQKTFVPSLARPSRVIGRSSGGGEEVDVFGSFFQKEPLAS